VGEVTRPPVLLQAPRYVQTIYNLEW
jgi:hypothetical protein